MTSSQQYQPMPCLLPLAALSLFLPLTLVHGSRQRLASPAKPAAIEASEGAQAGSLRSTRHGRAGGAVGIDPPASPFTSQRTDLNAVIDGLQRKYSRMQ